MARGSSRDLRERLLRALASGVAAVELARTTGVSPSSLRRWKQKQATGVSLAPASRPVDRATSRRTTSSPSAPRWPRCPMPDATLADHCSQWTGDGHVPVSLATMSRALVVCHA
jgi:transposase-like protein